MSTAAAKPGRRQEETIVKKVSRRAHHEDHGGNWKVAFADFCLALLCLFMVLWILTTRDKEEAIHKLHISAMYDGGTGIFEADVPRPEQPSLMEPLVAMPQAQDGHEGDGVPMEYGSDDELRALAAAVEQAARDANLQANLQAVITPSGLRIMLHDTHRRGIFELGSAVPDPVFHDLMQRIGQLLTQVGNPMLVVGHTDARKYPHPMLRSNWHLSSERAMAARNSLLQGGLSIDQLLQVVGMADRAPLDPVDPRGALNRRIEFLVLTQERARMMEQMFGRPTSVVPLMEGIDAAS
ncbi:histidine kinase [Dyella sp. M7H15-1]|uniref:flagellar motor protein MotB n=1 Tax=Dyella sp. M7H15-1 TaxID=2501295 RepID=UPI001004FD53|nr:flagellar motor protein MotB [Dyella sp. M7H15-1]QAU24290.1 histidine kinase [Dyella sp. M7H15-1]